MVPNMVPCFHDTYLEAFNQPNVSLVQTDPKGLRKATCDGLVVNGKEYELDILIFSTGYRSPAVNLAEPSNMSNMPITGLNGLAMAEKWATEGPGSLHGLTTHGFPNLFLTGPSMIGLSGNVTNSYEVLARHAAYIIDEATKRSNNPGRTVIQASKEAERAYIHDLVVSAKYHAPMTVCLPNYRNNEGEVISDADRINAAKATTYPLGMNAFINILEDWRAEGKLTGLSVTDSTVTG